MRDMLSPQSEQVRVDDDVPNSDERRNVLAALVVEPEVRGLCVQAG
jgi:hypothetical protein